MVLTDILDQIVSHGTPVLGGILNTQIDSVLGTIRDTPYSAFVSNLILVLIAILSVIVGLSTRWVASHPDQSRNFVNNLRNHPMLAVIDDRYRLWIQFLVRRFNPKGAYGFSLTLGLIAIGLSIWALGEITGDVIAQDEMVYFDAPIVVHIVAHRIDWLTSVMRFLTYLGNGWFVISLGLACGSFLRYKTGSWQPLLLLVATIAGAGILDLILKIGVARPRPLAAWMAAPATGYSFPSGHTALSAVYGTLAYLLSKSFHRWRSKVIIWQVAIALAFLIGVSRVYLGVHWPTDVLGGWALATLWLSVVCTAAATIEQTRVGPQTFQHSLQAEPSILSPILPRSNSRPDGLSEAEVSERISLGQVNISKKQASRSFGQIIKANVFTKFNALLGSLLVVILLIGPVQDALFGIIIMLNLTIGIIQELRAKWTLEGLLLLTALKSRVVRSGEVREIRTDQIVIDDVIELRSGDQVPVDGVVVHSNNVEVDETLLSGESEPVTKQLGAEIYSGSFIIAGSCRIQAVCVGEQAYARKLANAARRFEIARSDLREGINRILGYITWFLIPTALLLIFTQILYMQSGWRDAIAGSVAGVVGMVPEGLVLLTSVAMAAAVVRLARRNALIQELAAVELLARVDVLCLDKTGTLTDGRMGLEEIIQARKFSGMPEAVLTCDPKDVLGVLAKLDPNPNASLAAIASACPPPEGNGWGVKDVIPFSSVRKWSAAIFERQGTWVLGAPEVVLAHLEPASPLWPEINKQTRNGKRVLALSFARELPYTPGGDSFPMEALAPAAIIILGEHLRPDVEETLQFFKDQGVAIKVISGDNPQTVSAFAAAAGVSNAELIQDGRTLPKDPEILSALVEKYTVFGRVTPEQKRLIISSLKKNGHVVGMIGDGVNDVLAIKEAQFGIAMGSGTYASRAIAQLVLLSNDFAVLPSVIAEGRRVIANIERTANLFITKTVYVFTLALAVGVAQVPFPFLPRHLTLIGAITIGTPAFLLSLSPNTSRVKNGFVTRILGFAIPAGGLAAAATLIAYALTRQIVQMDIDVARTAATFTLMGCGLSILKLLSRPVNVWQRLFVTILIIILGTIVFNPSFRDFFGLVWLPTPIWAIVLIITMISYTGLKATWKETT
jgi:cation-transporting ATPase E